MKRTHKKSMFKELDGSALHKLFILQIEPVTTSVDAQSNYAQYLVEYLSDADAQEYLHNADAATPGKQPMDMAYEDALTTTLNRDPRGQYSGKTLKEIFESAGGKEWVKWALANMHNEFIRERVQTIAERWQW